MNNDFVYFFANVDILQAHGARTGALPFSLLGNEQHLNEFVEADGKVWNRVEKT